MRKFGQRFTVLTVMTLLLSLFLAANSFAEVTFKGKVGTSVNNMACFRGKDTMPGTDFQLVTLGAINMKGAGPGTFNLGFLGKYGHDLGADKGLKNKRNDITLSYTLPLFEKKMFLTLGNTSYIFSKSTATNLNEAFIAVRANAFLSPTFTLYYDYETENNGLFMTAKVSHGFKLNESLKLGLAGLVSYNDESSVKLAPYSALHNAEAVASLNWSVTKQLSIIPNVLVSTPLSDDAEDIGGLDDEIRYGVKMLVKF